MSTFAFVITHAAHLPERKLPCAHLVSSLVETPRHKTVIYSGRGKPHEWSLAQWKLGLEQDAEYIVCLNDDMVACKDLYDTLDAVIAARPEHIINLYNTHPISKLADEGGYRWVTSPDGLIGNAYLFPRAALVDFVAWRELLPSDVYETLSEDQLINLWCMQNEYLVWHTVPALFDHDTSIPSAYGNTQLRSPMVGPRSEMPKDWDTDGLHSGRNFTGNHWSLVTKLPWGWVKEYKLLERAYALDADFMPVLPTGVPPYSKESK